MRAARRKTYVDSAPHRLSSPLVGAALISFSPCGRRCPAGADEGQAAPHRYEHPREIGHGEQLTTRRVQNITPHFPKPAGPNSRADLAGPKLRLTKVTDTLRVASAVESSGSRSRFEVTSLRHPTRRLELCEERQGGADDDGRKLHRRTLSGRRAVAAAQTPGGRLARRAKHRSDHDNPIAVAMWGRRPSDLPRSGRLASRARAALRRIAAPSRAATICSADRAAGVRGRARHRPCKPWRRTPGETRPAQARRALREAWSRRRHRPAARRT